MQKSSKIKLVKVKNEDALSQISALRKTEIFFTCSVFLN